MRGIVVKLVVASMGSAGIVVAIWSISGGAAFGTSDRTFAWLTVLGCSSLVLAAGVCISLRIHGVAVWLGLLSSLWWTLGATNRTLAPNLSTAIEIGSRAALPVAAAAALLLVAQPGRRRRSRPLGLGVLTVATLVAVSQVDPFINPDCWRNCVPNGVSVSSDPQIQVTLRWALAAIDLTWCGIAVNAVVRSLERRRRASTGVDVIEVLAGLACVALVGSVAFGAVSALIADLAPRSAAVLGYAVACLSAAGLCGCVCAIKLADDRKRDELRRVAAGLVRMLTPDALEASLARALVDPELEVLYWVESRQAWVGGMGDRRAGVRRGAERGYTTIIRGDTVIAQLQHSRPTDVERVESWIGPALRLTIENASLIAASRAEVSELRASRERIVTRADDERVRLERDLHDGAQQRVVGLALWIGMLRDDARRAETPELPHVEQLAAITDTLLHELRAVARGIHPALLDDAGLEAALLDLAEGQSDVVVEVHVDLESRPDPSIEAAIYLVVETALADAVARSAATVDVGVSSSGRALRADIVDDGLDRATAVGQILVDRVAVLGGSVQVDVEPVALVPGRRVVRAEVPCVS